MRTTRARENQVECVMVVGVAIVIVVVEVAEPKNPKKKKTKTPAEIRRHCLRILLPECTEDDVLEDNRVDFDFDFECD